MQKLRASESIKAMPISETDSEVGKLVVNLDLEIVEREFLSALSSQITTGHRRVCFLLLAKQSRGHSPTLGHLPLDSGLTYRQ